MAKEWLYFRLASQPASRQPNFEILDKGGNEERRNGGTEERKRGKEERCKKDKRTKGKKDRLRVDLECGPA